jgi:hypothetical protein
MVRPEAITGAQNAIRFWLKGKLNLGAAAVGRRVNGGGDPVGMLPNARPLGAARDNDLSEIAACRGFACT